MTRIFYEVEMVETLTTSRVTENVAVEVEVYPDRVFWAVSDVVDTEVKDHFAVELTGLQDEDRFEVRTRARMFEAVMR